MLQFDHSSEECVVGLSAGTRLGPYEIVSELGAGGMGEVYRARDAKLGRDVALKVLPEAFARDGERMARFQREAKVLASLNHSNIASIYGLEDSGPTHALVMELVEGPTLADRMLAGPLPAEEALAIAKQVCEALEYAHERGIVHRDVKPANIKVAADGTVKLLDFGLAKALEDLVVNADISSSPTFTHMATQAGLILGTAAYMSPEQAKGRPVDRRSDIWAFGCVWFEMLTGKMAFSGESVTDTLAEIIKAEPDWNLIHASTPIRTLLQRCLKKDAKQRLQAIGEARIIIEEVLAAPAGTSVEEDEIAKGGTPEKRSRSVVGWIGGFAAVVVIAAVATWLAMRSGSAPAAMHFSAMTSFAGVQAQPALSPDGRSVAFVSNRDGHYNVYVGLVRGGQLLQITHDASLKSRPAWSPDGSTLGYAQMNDFGTMDIWEVAALGGSPHKVVLNATDPAWTLDGHSLAYVNMGDGTICISGVEGENPHVLVRMDPGYAGTEPRISPDGKMVAVAAREGGGGPYGELGVSDITTGKFRLLTHDNALALSPAWSPDSRVLYFSSSRGGTLNIWKIGTDGSGLRQVTAGEGDDTELDVSSDGKRLVFATLRLNIGLTQLDLQAKPGESNMKIVATDPARNEFGPTYSPDGTHIAFFTNLKGVENESIGFADANGSEATQLVRDSRINLFPRWAPDGSRLVFLSVGQVGNGGEYRSVAISGGAPQTITQAPFGVMDVGRDGRLLFVKGTEGDVEAFDPRDGKPHTLGNIKGGTYPRWSSDGSAVVYGILSLQEDDPAAGIWVTDFKTAPRQVFRGWTEGFTVGAQNEIFILKAKADLNGELWKVKADGSGLSRVPGVIPLLYSPNYLHSAAWNQMDVSPDGRRVVFQSQQVLQENIGIIDNLP
jgi:Tol biopolymer transport system component